MNHEERIKPWPLNGYAPGNYMNKCQVCGTTMSGVDKLCFVCLECAASSANEINQSLYLKIQALEAENKELKEIRDKYSESARVIHLHLQRFCNEGLPFSEMIADASRSAAKHIERLESQIAQLKEALKTLANQRRIS